MAFGRPPASVQLDGRLVHRAGTDAGGCGVGLLGGRQRPGRCREAEDRHIAVDSVVLTSPDLERLRGSGADSSLSPALLPGDTGKNDLEPSVTESGCRLDLRFWVELRGFEPLTPSMRTRCATGLRHSPKTGASVANIQTATSRLPHRRHPPAQRPAWNQSPTARTAASSYWSYSWSPTRPEMSMISAFRSTCSEARSVAVRERSRAARAARAA